MIIGIDFDGTCVKHEYPYIGPDVPGAVDVLTELAALDHRMILWTMRSDSSLQEAAGWFEERDIPLFGINSNPHQWSGSPKAYCHLYIDDSAFGCPLIDPAVLGHEGRPYVDWHAVERGLRVRGVLPLIKFAPDY